MNSPEYRNLSLNPIKLIKELLTSSLVKNAGYIFAGVSFVPSIFGLLYWVISSRFYNASDVGIAAAIMSAIFLVSLLSSLGTNIGIIRFIPESSSPNRLVNSVLNLNIIVSLIMVVFFFIGLPLWGEKIRGEFIKPLAILLFTLTVILSTLLTTIRESLIGFRNSKLAFIYMLVFNILRVCFVIFGTKYQVFGLVGSLTLAFVLANIFGIFILLPKSSFGFYRSFRIDWEDIKNLLPFSGANYLATIILNLPATLLPILTLEILGAEANAYSYVVMMVGIMIASPGVAIALSAFAEGSHNFFTSSLIFKKAFVISMGFTILVSAIIVVTAHWLLLPFGTQYAKAGEGLFRWFAYTAPFIVLNQILISYLRVQKLIVQIVIVCFIQMILNIIIAFILLPKFGIQANGFATFVANLVVSIIFTMGLITKKLVNKQHNLSDLNLL